MRELDIPGTNVQQNLGGIRDPFMMGVFENAKAGDRMTELRYGALKDFTPDFEGLKKVHKHLFQDVYPTAGVVRGETVIHKGKTFKPDMPETWNRWDHGTNKIVATFASRPLTDRRHQTLSQNVEKLKSLSNKGVFGEQAVKEAIPVLSKVIGDMNHLHPFWDGNGRAMKGFLEQTGRSFGLKMNTNKMERDDWIKASAAARKGRTGSLTKLLRSHVVVLNREELAADTMNVLENSYKAIKTTTSIKKKEGLATPKRRSLFSRLFGNRVNRTAVVSEKATARPSRLEAPLVSDNRHINRIVGAARAVEVKVGDHAPEIHALQQSILSAARANVPLLGPKADPALLQEMGRNRILMGEILSAQGAVDKINETKDLLSEIGAERTRILTPPEKLQKVTQEIVNGKGSNVYLEGLAETLAGINPDFGRGYATARGVAKMAFHGIEVKTQMTPEQLEASVKGLDQIKAAEARTLDAAKDLFKNPEAAIAKLADMRASQGLDTRQLNKLITSRTSSLGELKPFKKSETALMKRSVASFRQAVEAQGQTVSKAVARSRMQQKEIIEGLKTSVAAPSADLGAAIDKVQTSKQKLKALPAGVDKGHVHKEAVRFTDSLNEKTQIFGQAIPGISDQKMAQMKALGNRANVVKTATMTKVQTQTRSIGRGLGM